MSLQGHSIDFEPRCQIKTTDGRMREAGGQKQYHTGIEKLQSDLIADRRPPAVFFFARIYFSEMTEMGTENDTDLIWIEF